MVRRVVFYRLLRSLLSLLLIGLFLGGSTASYCLTKREHNGSAACSKKKDQIEKFTRSAPAADAIFHVPSFKLPVFVLFLLRKTVPPSQKKPAKAFGYPVYRDTYLASILVHFIVKNAP
jgi:hypothetical protein